MAALPVAILCPGAPTPRGEARGYAALRFDGRTLARAAAESLASSRPVVRQRAAYAATSLGSSIEALIIAFSRRITARMVRAISAIMTVPAKMMKRGVIAKFCIMVVSIPLVAVPNACACVKATDAESMVELEYLFEKSWKVTAL